VDVQNDNYNRYSESNRNGRYILTTYQDWIETSQTDIDSPTTCCESHPQSTNPHKLLRLLKPLSHLEKLKD